MAHMRLPYLHPFLNVTVPHTPSGVYLRFGNYLDAHRFGGMHIVGNKPSIYDRRFYNYCLPWSQFGLRAGSIVAAEWPVFHSMCMH